MFISPILLCGNILSKATHSQLYYNLGRKALSK